MTTPHGGPDHDTTTLGGAHRAPEASPGQEEHEPSSDGAVSTVTEPVPEPVPAAGGSGDHGGGGHRDDRDVDDPERTERIPAVNDADEDGGSGAHRRRRRLLVGAAVVGLLALLYVGDLLISSTDVPRGVTVAGVSIGGMSKPAAADALRTQLGARTTQPVTLQANGTTATLDPAAAGLELDVDGTIARAGEQPFNPWTRVSSLFSDRAVEPVSRVNAFTFGQALDAARARLDRPGTEGTIRFDGAQPVAVPSVPGQTINGPRAASAIVDHWLDPAPVAVPVDLAGTTVTPEGIQAAIEGIARPAVAGPVTIVGDAKNATITPEDVGRVLVFRPDGRGGLVPAIDEPAATAVIGPQLASTEHEPRDATLDFAGATSTVVPAVLGRKIDWPRTDAGLLTAFAAPPGQPAPPVFTPPPPAPGAEPAAPPPATGRAVNAAYTTTQPRVTTEQLAALGPAQVIGEFTTGGFAADSGQNIRRVAEIVNGAVIAPNSVFSLNNYTGPRDAGQGFVDAGIIEDGVPARGVGGGISQFATTLYNASYFAGMDDVAHTEHSYWISRYPAGREATVFEGSIDLRIGNSGPTPVYIRTQWSPSSITVQIYGQKRFDVTSEPGPRTNPVDPGVRDNSANPRCTPSVGVAGFTVTDTRVLRDVVTGEIRRQPRTVRYDPEPEITCNAPR